MSWGGGEESERGGGISRYPTFVDFFMSYISIAQSQ